MPYTDLYGDQIRAMTASWGDAARRFIESSTEDKKKTYEALATHYQNAQATGDWKPMRAAMRAMDPKAVQKFEQTTGIVIPDEPTPQVAATDRGLKFTPGKEEQVPWPSTFEATRVRQAAEQRKQPPDPFQITLSAMELIKKAPQEAQEELYDLGVKTGRITNMGRGKDVFKKPIEWKQPPGALVEFWQETYDITPSQAMDAYQSGKGMNTWQLRDPNKPLVPELPDISDLNKYMDTFEGEYWREYKDTGRISNNEKRLPAERKEVPGWKRQLSIDISRAYRDAGMPLDPNTALATMDNPDFDWEPYHRWVESQAGAVELLRLIRAVPKENRRERERLMGVLAEQLGYDYKIHKRWFKKLIDDMLNLSEAENALKIEDPDDFFRDIVIR